jgi:hypothetical protein
MIIHPIWSPGNHLEADARGRRIETVFHIVNESSRLLIEFPVRRVLSEGQIGTGQSHASVGIADDSPMHAME